MTDSRYIPAFSIEDVILDKDTGAPLSGGLVYFEQDNQRGVLKDIYQITGTSPNYTFIQLSNPVTLSSIGTFADDLGNPIIPYFYPYDGAGDPEYYYIRVTNSLGVEQFTREAQPYITAQSSSEALSAFTNEISNPQFAEVNFDTTTSTYTYTITGPVTDQVISIAPNWDLIVSAPAAGTVTLAQTKPTGTTNILTNAGTLLNINSSGLTKLQLRQRLLGSPNLWGRGYLSGTFVAKTYSGTEVVVTMYYSQSSGTTVNIPIVTASLPATGVYTPFPGSALIPSSTNGQVFPTAYVDIYFDLPRSIQMDITSVMVTFTGDNSINNMVYDQESYARQIDHLYHYAYPIVPVGTVIDYHGFTVPAHYLKCNNQLLNRVLYQKLFRVLTIADTATWTGLTTFTVPSSTNYWIGMPVEGVSIPALTTVTNIVGTTITISNNRTGTDPSVRFFATGAGNGSTTFNAPDLLDYVIAGVGGSLFGAGRNGVGGFGGTSTHAITIAEMPAHNHPGSSVLVFGSGGGGTLATAANSIPGATTAVTVASQGSGTAMTIVQQTALLNKLIRFE